MFVKVEFSFNKLPGFQELPRTVYVQCGTCVLEFVPQIAVLLPSLLALYKHGAGSVLRLNSFTHHH